MQNTGVEQRRNMRSSISARAELRLHTGVLMEGNSRDISLTGIFIHTDRMLPVGNTCHLTVVLEGGASEFRIDTKGEVVRVDEDGIAVEFYEVALDSLQHLCKLLLYNADEPELIEEELAATAGIRRVKPF